MTTDQHFLGYLLHARFKHIKPECDFSDRINCNLTFYLLCFFALVVTVRTFIHKPIACFLPTEFTESQVDFSEAHCWTEGTWVYKSKEQIPENIDQRLTRVLPYYQWIPIALVLMGLFFYVPYVVWNLFAPQSGINVC